MTNNFDRKKYLRVTVDRFENDKAILVLDDGQMLNWPADNLPPDINEGSQFRLVILTDKDEEKERQEIAKALLNEMLKVD